VTVPVSGIAGEAYGGRTLMRVGRGGIFEEEGIPKTPKKPDELPNYPP